MSKVQQLPGADQARVGAHGVAVLLVQLVPAAGKAVFGGDAGKRLPGAYAVFAALAAAVLLRLAGVVTATGAAVVLVLLLSGLPAVLARTGVGGAGVGGTGVRAAVVRGRGLLRGGALTRSGGVRITFGVAALALVPARVAARLTGGGGGGRVNGVRRAG